MKVDLIEAIKILQRGGIVIIPTETVYGIAARYDCDSAIEKLYRLKSRPRDKPCSLHLHSVDQAEKFVDYFPTGAKELMDECWPGPLTLILPANVEASSEQLRGGKKMIGIRVPSHETTQELIRATGPLIASSANPAGHKPLNSLYDMENIWGSNIPILTEGVCPSGESSTILEHTEYGWKCVRKGGKNFFCLQTLHNVF